MKRIGILLKEGKKLKAGAVGNAFITYDEFDVEWIDDNTLKVNNIQSINIFEQKMKIDRVNVTYNYIKE